MTSLSTRNLTRTFGSVTAVDDVTIDLPDGRFVCLLGPSGCGKTTLLRLIAGLEDSTGGQLLVDGIDQRGIPAHKRNFGMVFQSLALFPHLSVAENIAYPLKIKGIPDEERRHRVRQLLELVRLPGVGKRRINQLSGGQRQRVAIARGLAIDPRLFLLDEPLSALDAKLREHMQRELRQIQRKLGVTTIVVTHDQREAMSMADLVIVMNEGKVLQAAPPMEIYRSPADTFVANFIGQSNLLPCTIQSDRVVRVLDRDLALPDLAVSGFNSGDSAVLSVRPEDITVTCEHGSGVTGVVSFVRDLGASVEINLSTGEHELISVCTPRERPNVTEGQTVGVQFHTDSASVLPP